MKIVLDLSYYNELTPARWDLLAPVIDGVIVRLGFGITLDNMADDHIIQCHRINKPYAGYVWSDPTRTVIDQVGMVQKAISLHSPASVFLDCEQYWRDWGAYMRGDYAAAYATRFTPAQLNDFYLKNYNATKAGVSIPVGNYSADWFIDRYAPAMAKWIFKENYWEARYLRYYDAAWWNAKKKELGQPFDVKYMKDIAAYVPIVRGIGRQFESYIQIKGFTEWAGWHMDWNVFTDESYYRMFNQQVSIPEPPPVVIPPSNLYKVIFYAVWVRKFPNGTIIGYKWRDDVVAVVEISGEWARLEQGGWVGIKCLTKVQQ